MPGSPATPAHPIARRAAYLAIGTLLALTGGFGNALLVANLPQIQGALGVTPVEGGWLTAAYSMTNVCMSLLLIKFRQQFGAARFTRVFLPAFVLVCALQLAARDYKVELAVRAASGVVGSGLTTVALFYVMQAMPPTLRLGGMVLGTGLSQVALPLARVVSPWLLEGGDVHALYLFELGLALGSLGAAALLPLPPSESVHAFEPLDFVTFLLFAPGIALLCGVFAVGRIVWWTTPWIGGALAVAIVLVAAAMLVEHERANPLLNTRWMASSQIVQFALLGATMRVLLSEQGFGASGLLAAVGMGQEQVVSLYAIVSIATLAGLVASLVTLDMKDLVRPVVISLALIAIGAFMDARANNLTRPAELYFSQALIGFATTYFMGPMMMTGILRALARGPSHIVSYSAVFGISQSLGGLAGGALLGTLQIASERVHSNALVQSLVAADPLVATRIDQLSQSYGRVVTDPALLRTLGATLLSQQATREANILAYNDVFLLIGVLAVVALGLVGARWVHYRRTGTNPLAAEMEALARLRAQRSS
jgi:MFS family permease